MSITPFDSFISNIQNKTDIVKNIIELKVFRKLFYSTYQKYVGENHDNEYSIKGHVGMMKNHLAVINFLYEIYQQDFNYDLVLKYIDQLLFLRVPKKRYNSNLYPWIRNNISMDSFLHMYSKKLKDSYCQKKWNLNYKNVNSEFSDILNMMSEILKHGGELIKITPLRFDEYHNKLVRIHLRSTIKEIEYPKYFLKVPYKEENLEVVEPTTSYELAEWATTVKNCVYSYENSILNGNCAIFLIKEDGKPKFTVEVCNPKDGRNSRIGQVEKIYKSSMTKEERTTAERLIQEIILKQSSHK